ncbi:MAG: nucleotide-diphospho-sugar transferase [Benjaminiella poitrasii]|nr:MAG: nucleotide-diphospho-sugar transferase [Benjaminiella poitrasii]
MYHNNNYRKAQRVKLAKEDHETDIELRGDVWDGLPVKGAFYMIVHNDNSYQQLEQAQLSMRSLEERLISPFVSNMSYPWIFLNSQRFTPQFKKAIRSIARNPKNVYFGQIDPTAWTYPPWIDTAEAEKAMYYMTSLKIQNIHSLHDRKKNRYQAGLFYHHSLFRDVDYVWRVEPGTSYTCNLFQHDEDPFQTMKSQKKKIGPAKTTIMDWLKTKDQEYNFCYLWSAFEIVSLDFLRSEQYNAYFHTLDTIGGFFYERWSDSTVRTIAAAMFLNKNEIHYFNYIGLSYLWGHHCPMNDKLLNHCSCNYKQNHYFSENSCTMELLNDINPQVIRDMIHFAKSRWAGIDS